MLFAMLAVVTLAGGLEWLERPLIDLRYRLVQRDASDRLVVVEIDDRSLRALNVWPWRRSFHAGVIDRLLDAGAETIALDIDFSAHSNPHDDATMESALARAGPRVVLPAFKQRQSASHGPPLISETRPLPRFARHAILGSVAIQPDADSLVRQVTSVHGLTEEAMPSIAVLLGAHGRPAPREFYIDHGIRMSTIARISYVDVLDGNFPPDFFRGKSMLVGATAIELGDQLAVPLHVSAPGTMVLALAIESLRQDRAIIRVGEVPALAVSLLVLLLLTPRMAAWPWPGAFAAASMVSAGILGVSVAIQAVAPVSLDTAPALLAPYLSFLLGLIAVLKRQALRIFRQRAKARQWDLITRQIVENAFDAIVIVTHTGAVAMHNSAAVRLFGRAQENLVGRAADSLLRVMMEDGGSTVPVLALFDAGENHTKLFAGIAVNGQGDEVPVELSVRRVVIEPISHPAERRRHPRVYHCIAARDISERRRAEAALHVALQNAEAASTAKTRFLATISHELRTPLNAVIGFSEMIKEQSFGPVGNARYIDYAGDINHSALHLLTLINDILDVTRIESGEVQIKEGEVDIASCVASTLRLLEAQRAAADLDVVTEFTNVPRLIGDSRLVEQIAFNLISNAIKFTPTGRRVTIAAFTRPDRGISFRVTDTGIGIPPSEMPKLGRPFHQVDQSDTRKFGGAGLGLSIVRGLVERHGGKMSIASRPGAGTTVTCDFPPERTSRQSYAVA